MAQYDVYLSPAGAGYLLDVQADLLETFSTRLVVPLVPTANGMPIARTLNPVFTINETDVVMATQLMASVPSNILTEAHTNLSDNLAEIRSALDFVLVGF